MTCNAWSCFTMGQCEDRHTVSTLLRLVAAQREALVISESSKMRHLVNRITMISDSHDSQSSSSETPYSTLADDR